MLYLVTTKHNLGFFCVHLLLKDNPECLSCTLPSHRCGLQSFVFWAMTFFVSHLLARMCSQPRVCSQRLVGAIERFAPATPLWRPPQRSSFVLRPADFKA